MPANSVIGVSDFIISGCDYIIAGTDFIITGTDYRIDRHSDIFYAYVDKFSCSGDRLFLILCSFYLANPDGSEDLVDFNRKDRSYKVISRVADKGQGRYAYLLK